MHRKAILILMVCALVALSPALAQEGDKPATLLSMSHDVTAQPGHELQLEAWLKNHWTMHQAAGDPQHWTAWVHVTGKNSGMYSVRSTFAGWAELDKENGVDGDIEDVLTNMMPHVKHNVTKVTQWDLALSSRPDSVGTPNMVEITVFHLKPGSEGAFYHALGAVSSFLKGNEDIDWEWAWGHGVSGHNGATAVLAIPHENWASFADDGINMWKMLEKANGRIETDLLRDELTSSIKWQENYAVMHRPDLSYTPAE